MKLYTHSNRAAVLCAGVLATLSLAASPTVAAQADPAASRIEVFDSALMETLKAGPALGAKGRYHKLTPVIEQTFDLPTMTRFAVGPAWATINEPDRQALIKAFSRLSAANYAHNFDRFSGESFNIEPKVDTRGVDKIVQTKLTPGHGAPVSLTYRMRESGGAWKIIDVYYGQISQLTTRRSDFAAPLASGGAKGLLAHLDALTEKLLR